MNRLLLCDSDWGEVLDFRLKGVVFYNLDQSNIMQIDGMPSFRPITQTDLARIGAVRVCGQFSIDGFDQGTLFKLAATDTSLLYSADSQGSSPTHISVMSFDTKFEVLRETPWTNNETPGRPIGFRIQKQFESTPCETFSIFSRDHDLIQSWKKFLSRHINERNFHSLFKAKKQIGRGAFATVYLAERLEDKKMVAVKAFSKAKQYSGEQGKQSLINEISLLRKFDDPHILRLEGVYETQNSIYMIMEILEGRQLQDRLKNNEIKTPQQIQQILLNLLLALKSLAAQNVIHRDLKPQNIMFRKEGSSDLVICDFGLATNADQQKYLFVRCGTPGFVAPEIINIKDMSTKSSPISDVFSVGLIFHYLLIGQSIFHGKKYQEILTENRKCKFDFEREIYNRIHPLAMDLLRKMLQIDPQNRITADQAQKHTFFSQNMANLFGNPLSTIRSRSINRSSPFKGEMVDEKDQNMTLITKNTKNRKYQQITVQPNKENIGPTLHLSKKVVFGMDEQTTLRRSKRNSINTKRVSYKQNYLMGNN